MLHSICLHTGQGEVKEVNFYVCRVVYNERVNHWTHLKWKCISVCGISCAHFVADDRDTTAVHLSVAEVALHIIPQVVMAASHRITLVPAGDGDWISAIQVILE